MAGVVFEFDCGAEDFVVEEAVLDVPAAPLDDQLAILFGDAGDGGWGGGTNLEQKFFSFGYTLVHIVTQLIDPKAFHFPSHPD